jgi:hypothetical protein
MAIYFESANPAALLAAFKDAIDKKKVVTWSYDKDGDFTHTPEQWKNRGWLRPSSSSGRLTMSFLGTSDQVTTWEVYGIYHGRFIESMMVHCHSMFNDARAPSQPASSDSISTKVA